MSDNKEDMNAQLQRLLASIAEKQQGKSLQQSSQAAGDENLSPKEKSLRDRQQQAVEMAKKMVEKVQQIIRSINVNVDRFINFVVKSDDPDRNEIVQYARPPILFGLWVMLIFVIFGGLWAALAPLDSAAHAMGYVMASSNKQVVQYSGSAQAIVKKIFVKQGDYVKANQPIIGLDDTRALSDYEGFLNQYISYLAAEARLIAERDGADKIEFNEFIFEHNSPETQKAIHAQTNFFKANKDLLAKSVEVLQKTRDQHAKKLEAIKKNLKVISDRLKAGRDLLRSGHLAKKEIEEQERAEIGLLVELANTEQEIQKNDLEILRHIDANNQRISKELAEMQLQRAIACERFYLAKDALERIVVKSPVDGVVNQIFVHTIGALLPQNTMVAEVTPVNDKLIVEVRIPASNIDSVAVGQQAKLKFTAFKSRTSPLFLGTIVSISPDVIQDPQSAARFAQYDKSMVRGGDLFYSARVELDMDYFEKLAKPRKLKLVPGMLADVQIVTGTRTLLRYLLDPVRDQAFKAFKEK